LNKNLATIGKTLDGLNSIFITHGHGVGIIKVVEVSKSLERSE
jgi:anaerobic glycerol-3-phosphate dehydrogenase